MLQFSGRLRVQYPQRRGGLSCGMSEDDTQEGMHQMSSERQLRCITGGVGIKRPLCVTHQQAQAVGQVGLDPGFVFIKETLASDICVLGSVVRP